MSRAQVFWLSEAARQPLGPTHPIQWVLGTFSTGINLSGHTADHWLLSKAKNTWSFASTPLYLHGVHKVICTLYLFMQGTNLLSYYLCDFVLYLMPFMSCDNCIQSLVTTLYICKLVYFCRGWQRSNVREPFAHATSRVGFFVSETSVAWLTP